MSRATMHPTKAILVETVVEMLETIKPGDIQADKVLEISGLRIALASITKATQRHDLSKYRLERAN